MKRIDLDVDELVKKYLGGMSEKACAEFFNVSRPTIRKRLLESGIKPRGRSEAERLKWSQMSSSRRKAQVRAAHQAARGRTVPLAEKIKRAQAKQANGRPDSTLESKFGFWLKERGIPFIPQQAIGPYNCDFGLHPIAVEILGGKWHTTGRRSRQKRKAFRYFLDRGWHVFLIVHEKRRAPMSPSAVDELLSALEVARRNPSMQRKYWMIEGNGELILSRSESDKISLKWPFTNRRNPTTGRYERVPR